MILEDKIKQLTNSPSDINEHINTLKDYASKVSHITEFGVRAITSTYAFVAGRPKFLRSYDLEYPSFYGGNFDELTQITDDNHVDFQFIKEDVLKAEIEPTQLLFIDTFHAYDQLVQELKLHAPKVSKYIIMHDTTTFGTMDEPLTSLNTINKMTTGRGLVPAIDEFIQENPEWEVLEVFTNNNGLTILGRKESTTTTTTTSTTTTTTTKAPEFVKEIEVKVTEQTLKDNPDLADQGVVLGDNIGVPVTDEETTTNEDKATTTKTKPAGRTKK